MEQLEKLIDKLNTDSLCYVSVKDNDTGKYIEKDFTHQDIKADYETAEKYFESLYADGYTNLTIQERRKNGNSIKNVGTSFVAIFGDENEEIKTQKTTKIYSPVKPKKKKKKKSKKTKDGLMGLGMAEYVNLQLEARDKANIEHKLSQAELELKDYKGKYEQLKEEKLQRDFTVQKNDSLNNMLLGAFKQIPLVLNSLGVKVPVEAGLNASVEIDNNFTEVQQEFYELLPTLDDDSITLLKTIYNKINETTENNIFATKLYELMQELNMIT